MLHWLLKQLGKLTSRNKLTILIYHQVVDQKDPMRMPEPDTSEFDWQMKLIARNFNPISLPEAVKLLKQKRLPANSVCVTFDDGYINNLTVAQPILQRYKIPATVYIATGFSDGRNMWNDRLIDLIGQQNITEFNLSAIDLPPQAVDDSVSRAQLAYQLIPHIKYLPYSQRITTIDQLYKDNNAEELPRKMMSPEQIYNLSKLGVDIGAHTVDHPILAVEDEGTQKSQITQSKKALESLLGKQIIGFAYPNGKRSTDYDDAAVALAKNAGFEYAVSTEWGVSTPTTDPHQLRRFTPWDKTPFKFHLRLILKILGK
ncbi:polysaccharide deacetylase family protein [Neptunicella marina]|uniref:Polysaccharide deacetylase family protein n=1 Tax=Neptunicella marina TaxID=2125989 RepID=A0A8J6LZ18_9ALTE|nr:polysaccharide deacetylase family protein [Neptunicella marina]MBC3765770.1 polysaccharide deacetylase family protein [Neptunicella marina]